MDKPHKPKTYAQALDDIFASLGALGWLMSSPALKIRWAVAPDKSVKIWFKKESLLWGDPHQPSGNALSLQTDVRTASVDELVTRAYRLAKMAGAHS